MATLWVVAVVSSVVRLARYEQEIDEAYGDEVEESTSSSSSSAVAVGSPPVRLCR